MKKPSILYKYRSLDINTLSILNSGQVWFANRSQLNDPFDCHPDVTIDVPEDELDEFLEAFETSETQSFDFPTKQSIARSCLLGNTRNISVFCTSVEPCNELMWAHYADNHRGICIGFEVVNRKFSPETTHLMPWPVQYSGRGKLLISDPLRLKRDEISLQEYSLILTRQTFFQKSPAWKYEQEWRYVTLEKTGLQNLESRILSVVYGLRCNEQQRDVVRRLLPEDTSEFQIVISDSELVIEPVRLR